MKKFFGIAVFLYVLLAVGSGLTMQPIENAFLTDSDGSQTGGEGDIQPDIETPIWYPIAIFGAENQTDQLIDTDIFYNPGELFRISYRILPKTSAQTGHDDMTGGNLYFFLVEVNQVLGLNEIIAGFCDEGDRPEVNGSYEVEAVAGYYYLSIWSINCAEWGLIIESLN